MTTIPIRASEVMDKRDKWYEDKVIRVPLVYRQQFKIELDELKLFKEKGGGTRVLQVDGAYLEDVAKPPAFFVTSEIFNELKIELFQGFNIEKINNITLGCDPEFFLIDKSNGKIIEANRIVPKYGTVGHDGILMEIRPQPSISEDVVTNNIYQLLQYCRQMLNKMKDGDNMVMVGASSWNGTTAGFHLHYGLPSALLGSNYGAKQRTAVLIAKVADYYVGIPSIIPEGNEDCQRRIGTVMNYGRPGDYRIDGRTLEYRVPGGSCLRHPILTRGLMALGAIVIEDFVSRLSTGTNRFFNLDEISSFYHVKELYPNMPDIETTNGIIRSADVTPALDRLEIIMRDVRQMVGYKERANAVEEFLRILENKTKFGYNLEYNWGV